MSQRLIQAVTRYSNKQPGQGPLVTAIDGLTIIRLSQQKHPTHIIHKPALCIVVQGAKSTTFGSKRFDYKAGQALIVNVEMPGCSIVTEASEREPYLGVIIEFDLAIIRKLVEDLDIPAANGTAEGGAFVASLDASLMDCALRAVRLLDTPNAIPVLYPLIMKEICYWLVAGPYGGEVVRMTLGHDHDYQVIRAIHALRNRFDEPIVVKELASLAGLSPSAFHRKFKAVTSMTPIQYQKQLRLLEARSLLLTGAVNVESAAFQVGYESASQFSRDYSRMFEAPPRRDIVSQGRRTSLLSAQPIEG
jgi:AraC-like DNA-binding protein